MRVYIAGPYTLPEPIENVRRAILAADEVLALGHTPFVPHLNFAWNLVSPKPPATWYAMDLVWLSCCDAVLRLPGASVGAEAEVALANRLGLPVYASVAEIPPGGGR